MEKEKLDNFKIKNRKSIKQFIKNEAYKKVKGGYSSYIEFNKNKVNNNNKIREVPDYPKRKKSRSLILLKNNKEGNYFKERRKRFESFTLGNSNKINNQLHNIYNFDNKITDISNSSTFNSSGITKLKNNDNYNGNNNNRLLGILRRKSIKQNTTNFETFKYNTINNKDIKSERLNFPKLNSNSYLAYIPNLTDRTTIQNYKNFYHSRNINNDSPVKILSIDENYNSLTKTDDSKKTKSNLSLQKIALKPRRQSMELIESNIHRNKTFKTNIFETKNLSAESKEQNFNRKYDSYRKTVSFKKDSLNISENSSSNSNSDFKYNCYIPNFKRKKGKDKSKKMINKKKTKYFSQLSKISEIDNTNNSHLFSLKQFSYKKSITINIKKDIEKEEVKPERFKSRQKSFEFSSKKVINSLCQKEYFSKNKNSIQITSESEDSGAYHDSEEDFVLKPVEKKNTHEFKLKYLIPEQLSKRSLYKKNNKLFTFEEELKDDFRIINGNCFVYKNNLIEIFISENREKLNNRLRDIYKHIDNKLTFVIPNSEYIKEIKKDKNFINKKIYFEKKLFHSLKKLIESNHFFNYSFSNQFLLNKYLSLEIDRLIFKDKYLENQKQKSIRNILNNFSKEVPILHRASVLRTERRTLSVLNSLIPELNELPSSDFYFLLHFYQFDNEYNIIPGFFSVKIESIKLRVDINDYPFKSKKSKFQKNKKVIIINDFNEINQKEKRNKNDKYLLKNALLKNSFYKRNFRIQHRRRSTIANIEKLAELKNSYKNLRQKIIGRKKTKIQTNRFGNKEQMILEVNELKQKIIESLNNQYDRIMFYVKDKNFSRFKELYEKYKIDPEVKDKDGNSLLSLAVQSNSFQIVNYLLNVGANPNTQNNKNNTPLHYALTFHNYEIADILIKRGANEKAINKLGASPWQCLDSGLSII